jgi:hypothetical protein
MQQRDNRVSAGERFRAAVRKRSRCRWRGHQRLYGAAWRRRRGFKALYLSGGGVAANSLGMPDLGISTMEDVLTTCGGLPMRRLAAAGRYRHGLGRGVQHCADHSLDDQGRRGGGAHGRPGGPEALRASAGQGAGANRRDGGPHQGRCGCADRRAVCDHGADRCAGQ